MFITFFRQDEPSYERGVRMLWRDYHKERSTEWDGNRPTVDMMHLDATIHDTRVHCALLPWFPRSFPQTWPSF